tara:strand:+ start:612 stop:1307 length:696 start_codon:yes stop_codon:yes gene_type:complete
LLILSLFLKYVFQFTHKTVYEYDSFLSTNEIINLKKCLKRLKTNNLSEDNFKNSRSIVFYFNDHFLKNGFKLYDKFWISYFEIVNKVVELSPIKGNYYVSNILEFTTSDKITYNSGEDGRYISQPHIDQTICQHYKCSDDFYKTPEIVCVYYLKLPANMKGGNLNIIDEQTGDIIKEIKGKHNRLIYFKGDALHGVKRFYNNNSKRISIVIEIYNVKWPEIKKLPYFNIEK